MEARLSGSFPWVLQRERSRIAHPEPRHGLHSGGLHLVVGAPRFGLTEAVGAVRGQSPARTPSSDDIPKVGPSVISEDGRERPGMWGIGADPWGPWSDDGGAAGHAVVPFRALRRPIHRWGRRVSRGVLVGTRWACSSRFMSAQRYTTGTPNERTRTACPFHPVPTVRIAFTASTPTAPC